MHKNRFGINILKCSIPREGRAASPGKLRPMMERNKLAFLLATLPLRSLMREMVRFITITVGEEYMVKLEGYPNIYN